MAHARAKQRAGHGEASMRARASAEARFSLRCARRPFPPPALLEDVSQATCRDKTACQLQARK
jgi:hypothetical protein